MKFLNRIFRMLLKNAVHTENTGQQIKIDVRQCQANILEVWEPNYAQLRLIFAANRLILFFNAILDTSILQMKKLVHTKLSLKLSDLNVVTVVNLAKKHEKTVIFVKQTSFYQNHARVLIFPAAKMEQIASLQARVLKKIA